MKYSQIFDTEETFVQGFVGYIVILLWKKIVLPSILKPW